MTGSAEEKATAKSIQETVKQRMRGEKQTCITENYNGECFTMRLNFNSNLTGRDTTMN